MIRALFARRVVGSSMWPALAPDDIVIASGLIKPKVGEVVVARIGGRDIIKRVAAVSARGYWLLGDNRSQSTDSRIYGFVPRRNILGTAIGLRHTLRSGGLAPGRA